MVLDTTCGDRPTLKGFTPKGSTMFTYSLIVIVALIAYTYYKWDTVSPKLVVREAATVVGAVVGATPEVVKTTNLAVKAANAKTELELRQAGSQGPVGFREGTVIAKKATRDALRPVTNAAQEVYDDAMKELAKLDEKKEA